MSKETRDNELWGGGEGGRGVVIDIQILRVQEIRTARHVVWDWHEEPVG